MKKIVFVCFLSMLGLTAMAQNSAVERYSSETKVDKFLKAASLVKIEHLSEYSDNGIEVYPIIATDLKTGEKVGGVHLRTEYHPMKGFGMALLTGKQADPLEGASLDLGYVDVDELTDLINALNSLLQVVKSAGNIETLEVSYYTASGLGFLFNGKDEGMKISKNWLLNPECCDSVIVNVSTEFIKEKRIKKIIDELVKAQGLLKAGLK